MYKMLVDQYSKQLKTEIEYTIAQYNFDHGDELECALGRALRKILPNKYGVCRGCAINSKDQLSKGDDLIIFDRMSFPTLRSLHDDFSIKEHVPIEAIYMYIECKNTLEFNESRDGSSSFSKALTQVYNFKEMCDQRAHLPIGQFDPYIEDKTGQTKIVLNGLPTYRNPPYAMIFAKNVSIDNKKTSDVKKINEVLTSRAMKYNPEAQKKYFPDLIVAGEHNIIRPGYRPNGQDKPIPSFFMYNEDCHYLCTEAENNAFGLALIHILAILDFVRLHRLPWDEVIHGVLNPNES